MRKSPEWLPEVERLISTGRFLEAAACLQSHCTRHPGDTCAWFLLGACRHRMGELPLALQAFDHTLTLDPDHAQAALARVAVLWQDGHASAALDRARSWLTRYPRDMQMLFSAGVACEALQDLAQALAYYDGTLDLARDHPGAFQNRGIVLTRLGRVEEAVQNNRRFVEAHPQSPDAHYNLAESCLAMRDYASAIEAADRALELVPGHTPSRLDRGFALAALGQIDEARSELEKALRDDDGTLRERFARWARQTGDSGPMDPGTMLKPEDLYILAGYERVLRCDWTDYDAYVARCATLVDSAPADCLQSRNLAFNLLNLPIPAAVHRRLSERIARGIAAQATPLPRPVPATKARRPRLRIGYLSANFGRRATSHLTLDLYRLHDRERFEVVVYSLVASDGSDNFRAIQRSCDQFLVVKDLTDEDIARRIAGDGVDILVEMNGYTRGGRSHIAAMRPAPVQAQYVAYPATTGGNWIDYLIADSVVIPKDAERHYTENFARLPNCYLPNSHRGIKVPATPARRSEGLPADGFVFCAFHRHEKITPAVFSIWMRLLHCAPGSVLWLLQGPGADNLRRHAASAGIDPSRLVFAPMLEIGAHLARQRLADLFLDAHPCNAHTTATDALWADVPVLTCPGEHWVSRVGAALLGAVGLEDLIAKDLAAYEALAMEISAQPDRLRELKSKLARNRDIHPLFDMPRLVRNLDAAYLEMWRRHAAGERPGSFEVVEDKAAP